jgi:putative endonuclease
MFFVYILANKPYGTIYIGFTNNLAVRVDAHKLKAVDGFTKIHSIDRLVWCEVHEDLIAARTREKQLKEMESRLENQSDSVE